MMNFAKLAVLGAAVAIAAPFASATTIDSITAGSYGTATGVTYSATISPTATAGDPYPFIAQYTETVYAATSTSGDNFCVGCLNFVFQVKNLQTTPNPGPPVAVDPIESISVANFGIFSIQLGDVTGSGVSSLNAAHTTAGNTLKIDSFTSPLGPNQSLDTFVVFTNATKFGLGDITFQDGATVDGFAYVAGTPEPSSLVLMGSGLVSAGGILFRRRKLAA